MKARARTEEKESNLPSRVLPLITLSVFLSAALLFLLQPMFGKMILPMFGGAPAVWITSLVFFQLMLLAGYLYVHITAMLLGPRKQAALHAVLLLIPLVVLPIHIVNGFGLTSPLRPVSSVFLVLLASVGLPFFVVSTTAPLLQRWFGSTKHKLASDPYFLYAASNLGSIGALLLYPIVVEPHLALDTQARVWSIGYGLLIVLTLACAVVVRRSINPLPAAGYPLPAEADRGKPVAVSRRLRWLALAAVPSSLLLSVTSHITTDIAPVPLLWVIPLALYLLTFVLAFSPRTEFLRRFAWYALPFAVLIPIMAVLSGIIEPPGFMLIHLAVFFIAAMACHGELAATRPGVGRLTEFYVWLAIGGAIGGLFNVVIAPIIFRTQIEYPLGLIVTCLLLPGDAKSTATLRVRLTDVAIALSLGVVALIAHLFIQLFSVPRGTIAFIVYVFAIPGIIALFFFRRPVRFALSIAAIWLAAVVYPDSTQSVVAIERSFFGVHKIVDRGAYRVLLHGNTHHGAQSLRPDLRCTPLSYYYPTGPLGEMFALSPNRKTNIAVVGLGTGSTSGYARPGQAWTFYEIDPQMERIARNPRYFTFLRDCAPQARVILGDARLSLTNEPDSTHDLLIIDAFSSDAIPVHLLTREAMSVYTHKLARGGVIAFHISNRYVNLRRVLARLARDAHLVAYVREDRDVSPLETYEGKLPSVWVMMARTPSDLGPLANNARRWTAFPNDVSGASWTDNYSNVLETLKLHI